MKKDKTGKIVFLFTLALLSFLIGIIIGIYAGTEFTINSLGKIMEMADINIDKVEFSINETRMAEMTYELAKTNGLLKNISETSHE